MMAATTGVTHSVSSTARRHHYQSQASNASHTLNQSFNNGESLGLMDSFSSSSIPTNPLITIIYSNASSSQENQQLLLNSYSSCRRLLDHMKQIVGINQDETIDLMDNEGKLKELNLHFEDYATQYITPRSTYYILKIDVDTATGEKRYTPSFNLDLLDQKLGTILTNSFNGLNKSVKKRPVGPTSRQATSIQSSSNTPQSKVKRAPSRKQN